MCDTSCASTASTSSSRIFRSKPVLTATRASLRFMPVAKAFISGESYTATSGIPIPAALACRATVAINHCSVAFRGCSITTAPVERFAIHFDMAKDIKEPPKPNTAANTSNPPILLRSTPRKLNTIFSTMLSTNITARLVAKNKNTLFILLYLN